MKLGKQKAKMQKGASRDCLREIASRVGNTLNGNDTEGMSKTAMAALKASRGAGSRIPVAWVFEHRPGQLQTCPLATFHSMEEADAFVARNPEQYFKVDFTGFVRVSGRVETATKKKIRK